MIRQLHSLLLLALFGGASLLQSAPPAKPTKSADPGKLQSLIVETGSGKAGEFTLAGRDASQQLLVTGQFSSGDVRDLSRSSKYTVSPAGIVQVDSTGWVTPIKEGTATILIANGTANTKVNATVTHIVQDVPINFTNEVVPIFTKFGCNAGGCHGKASGQNGFKLSLLGFEPIEDFEYLVKEARGRRLFPASPARSLLLIKATGVSPHGGGKKLDEDSPFYRVMHRWIEQGSPFGKKDDPTVTGIEVFPKERVMSREGEQQLLVIAHLSDGSRRDVTRMTQFEVNVTDMGSVNETGLVTTKSLPGVVAVMTRFQSQVSVFRAMVPLGVPVTKLPTVSNFIDEHVFKQLKALGLPPSDLCDDGTFLRRAMIDIAGRLPTRDEAEKFLADKDPKKHEKLIDSLLASPSYADYFANKWSAILRNRRKAANEDTLPTFSFHKWIRDHVEKNTPYDRFVREILTATGEDKDVPQLVWYREVKEPSAQVEDVSQLFLGQRVGCARCHHHPFEKWSQEDYYGMVAFFSKVSIKDPPPAKPPGKGQPAKPREPLSVTLKAGEAMAVNPKTNKPVKATGLGSKPALLAKDEDPRAKLVDWMVEKDNPFFAKSLANRYWKHFFGRGLVDPEDDIRATNPASNPELLDALAKSFADSKYDLKKLVRTICTSTTYRLSAVPNEHNAEDRQNHSRYVPKRFNAEVLLDAIDDVTLSKTSFKGVQGTVRAVQLPDNQFDSYFLSVFGRPDSASACECERTSDATLAQALHMLNSTDILGKVSANSGRAATLAKDKRPHTERLRELYMASLARDVTPEELKALTDYIEKKGASGVQSAYEDILWAIINTKEFQFNH